MSAPWQPATTRDWTFTLSRSLVDVSTCVEDRYIVGNLKVDLHHPARGTFTFTGDVAEQLAKFLGGQP